MLHVDILTLSDTIPTIIYDGLSETGVQIKALSTNTGIIYVGRSDVVSTKAYPLASSETVFVPIQELNLLFAIAANNGDKISILIPKIKE